LVGVILDCCTAKITLDKERQRAGGRWQKERKTMIEVFPS
jgi:hypothetical protein